MFKSKCGMCPMLECTDHEDALKLLFTKQEWIILLKNCSWIFLSYFKVIVSIELNQKGSVLRIPPPLQEGDEQLSCRRKIKEKPSKISFPGAWFFSILCHCYFVYSFVKSFLLPGYVKTDSNCKLSLLMHFCLNCLGNTC